MTYFSTPGVTLAPLKKCLLATVHASLEEQVFGHIRQAVLERVAHNEFTAVVFDLSSVHLLDAMPSVGRKFLLAGKGGLNLTHSEPRPQFDQRYAQGQRWVGSWLDGMDGPQVRAWAQALGIDTFVGTSGRVFPTEMKAAPLLRAWLQRLRHPKTGMPVQFHMRHRWQGWEGDRLVFARGEGQETLKVRARVTLLALGGGSLLLLGLLRGFNIYGETLPWVAGDTALRTLMSVLNFTKYPPSLDFLLFTLGLGLLGLAWLESVDNGFTRACATFGGAPMFYYLLHLYLLLVIGITLTAVLGANHAGRYGVEQLWQVWLLALLLMPVLYFPCRAFAHYKRASRQAWVRYF